MTRGETRQELVGRRLAAGLSPGLVVHLRGEIGAGKTTLTRGLLRGLGVSAPVKSPTYTLIEPYEAPWGPVYHFDLYRLSDPEELQFFGAEEYFTSEAICILEWAERAGSALPSPDLTIQTEYRDADSRTIRVRSHTRAGREALEALAGEEGQADGE